MSLWRNFSRLATISSSTSSSRVGLFTLTRPSTAGNRFSTTQLAQPLGAISCSNFHCLALGHHDVQQKHKKVALLQHNLAGTQQLRGFSGKKHEDEADKGATPALTPEEELAKLGLFARFKKMYKEYWYVMVPVHCVTSAIWFGGFYYASTSGVDVIAILESMGVSEKLINPVRDSSLGHIAIAYLLYKIATPARYTVTLGGTTLSIKYLVRWGYVKPMPSKAQLVQMYKDKKADVTERIAERKQDLQERKQTMMDDLKSKKKSSPPGGVTDEK